MFSRGSGSLHVVKVHVSVFIKKWKWKLHFFSCFNFNLEFPALALLLPQLTLLFFKGTFFVLRLIPTQSYHISIPVFRYGMAKSLPEILPVAFGIQPDHSSEGLIKNLKKGWFFFLCRYAFYCSLLFYTLSQKLVWGLGIPTNSAYSWLRSVWSPFTMFLLGSAINDFVSPTLDSCYFFLVGCLPSRFWY